TVVGAGAGAAAGSAIGCEMQKDRAQHAGTYTRNGYRLSSDIAPASYSRIGHTFVATSGVNLRAAPTTGSARVGRLRAGERFQALAQVRGSDWILVGQGGVGVGYVRGDFVRPEGRRYAAY
uniref:SH3 domain-containing protein n=1 Tax=Phenylobacterium sp. TaxID=1871053 RepID=UPI0028122461